MRLSSRKLKGGRGKTAPMNGTSTMTTGIREVLILNLHSAQRKGSNEPTRSYFFTRQTTSSSREDYSPRS